MGYDLIVIGGGWAGATLARAIVHDGHRVLVVERETTFRDHVRGEMMHSWGVGEARNLDLASVLEASGGREIRYMATHFPGAPADVRDLIATTPPQAGQFGFFHPAAQMVLLQAAEEAGAQVRRGARVAGVTPGSPANVRSVDDRSERTCSARFVVGADGRTPGARAWGGFTVQLDAPRMTITGVLLERIEAPEDRVSQFINTQNGHFAATIPLGDGRFRSYAARYRNGDGEPRRLDLAGYTALAADAGLPAAWFARAQAVGPLASFDAADAWVPHPYRGGVALVGDAAASSDPCFGCGLALALRDVRALRDRLRECDNWDAAGHAYAADHDAHYGAIHRLTDWFTQWLFEPGEAAAARRARTFAGIAEGSSRVPDLIGLGPDAPTDETTRRRLFAEA